MNKQQLASKIWESANKMRPNIEAYEYKDYILGFIFYKFLSEKEEEYLNKIGLVGEERKNILVEGNYEIEKNLKDNLGYFIEYNNLFSTWLRLKNDFTIANVRDALNAFSRNISKSSEKVFKDIFLTLQTGLSNLGKDPNSQTKAVRDLVTLINDIPMNNKQDYDVLGFVYEYLISNFAANAGKKAGEFYTPHEVSLLMSEIIAEHLKNKENIEIYDPTSGSGSLLINIGKTASKYIKGENKIKYYAQEIKQNTYNLTRMNLIMRGILPQNIITRNGDTLAEDWPFFDESHTYSPLFVDAVVSNPPYSQNWDTTDMELDKRFREYGVAPKGKADYAFLLHDLYHLKSDGIMTIVLPHGVLFRGGEEEKIRKNLVEKNNIDTIIGLPANIFFGTGIPTIIMILKKQRTNTDIQIIDASKGFIKEGKNNKLRACDIKKIVDAVIARKDITKFSKVVSKEEIRNNDYNLNIPRYVDSSEGQEHFDIYALMNGGIPAEEIEKYNTYWQMFPSLKDELFDKLNEKYYELKNINIEETINTNQQVIDFKNNYKLQINKFKGKLIDNLINNIEHIDLSNEENILSDELFKVLNNNKLIDNYNAFQLLDDNWNVIMTDIEMIQTEGISTVKKIDPRMIVKKKDGKEIEVQNGYVGHIIPFEFIQKIKLNDRLDELNKLNERLSDINLNYEEFLDEMEEEDKSQILNDNNDAIDFKKVNEKLKEIRKDKISVEPNSFEEKIEKLMSLNNEEKEINRSIRLKNKELLDKSKEAIEGLDDNEIKDILEKKWIEKLVDNLTSLIDRVLKEFVKDIENMSKKYENTLTDINNQINTTEKELIKMLDELTGEDYDMKGINDFKSTLGGE